MPKPTRATLDMRSLNRGFRALKRAEPKMRTQVHREVAETLLAEAKQPGVIPIDTGFLADSDALGRVDAKAAEFGFTAKYAAPVHANHPTKAGWFQRILIQIGPKVVRKAIAKAFREAARSAERAGRSAGGAAP